MRSARGRCTRDSGHGRTTCFGCLSPPWRSYHTMTRPVRPALLLVCGVTLALLLAGCPKRPVTSTASAPAPTAPPSTAPTPPTPPVRPPAAATAPPAPPSVTPPPTAPA